MMTFVCLSHRKQKRTLLQYITGIAYLVLLKAMCLGFLGFANDKRQMKNLCFHELDVFVPGGFL